MARTDAPVLRRGGRWRLLVWDARRLSFEELALSLEEPWLRLEDTRLRSEESRLSGLNGSSSHLHGSSSHVHCSSSRLNGSSRVLGHDSSALRSESSPPSAASTQMGGRGWGRGGSSRWQKARYKSPSFRAAVSSASRDFFNCFSFGLNRDSGPFHLSQSATYRLAA